MTNSILTNRVSMLTYGVRILPIWVSFNAHWNAGRKATDYLKLCSASVELDALRRMSWFNWVGSCSFVNRRWWSHHLSAAAASFFLFSARSANWTHSSASVYLETGERENEQLQQQQIPSVTWHRGNGTVRSLTEPSSKRIAPSSTTTQWLKSTLVFRSVTDQSNAE